MPRLQVDILFKSGTRETVYTNQRDEADGRSAALDLARTILRSQTLWLSTDEGTVFIRSEDVSLARVTSIT